jgi:FixJ family two-component response regulator
MTSQVQTPFTGQAHDLLGRERPCLMPSARPAPVRNLASNGHSSALATRGRVAVIDADRGIRDRLVALLERAGFDCAGHAGAAGFLAESPTREPTCAVLGFRLADGRGLALQQALSKERRTTSVIFQTAGESLETAVQAMKAGALDVLTRPFDEQAVLAAVKHGLDHSQSLLEGTERHRRLVERHACLTSRERQVLCLVAAGLLNKQIAYALDLSEITVKAHRGRMMRKMSASSIADLVIMADRLGLDLAHPLSRRS